MDKIEISKESVEEFRAKLQEKADNGDLMSQLILENKEPDKEQKKKIISDMLGNDQSLISSFFD